MAERLIPIASAGRRYRNQIIALMICYAAVLVVSLRLIHYGIGAGWVRIAIALMPVVPIVFVLLAVIRLLSRVDELYRRIHLESAALSAGTVALIALASGFLHNVGVPQLSGFAIFVLIAGCHVFFGIVLTRRYR